MTRPSTGSLDPDLRDDEPFDDGVFETVPGFAPGILTSSTVHDRTQFEANFDLDALPPGPGRHKRYEIDTWFFVPRAMGIHEETYGRDQFFADLTNYLRLRTPEDISFERLDPSQWHLPALDRYLAAHLDTLARQRMLGLVQQEVRLFGCLMNTQFKRLLREAPRHEALANVGRLKSVLDRYRKAYLHRVLHEPLLVDLEVRRALRLVDEYLSYRFEAVAIRCLKPLAREGDPMAASFRGWLEDEVRHRAEAGLVRLDDDATAGEQAELLNYRLGLLKKYVAEVLFLKVHSIKREKLYRNLVAAVGAGLAATWAAMTDLQRLAMMRDPDLGYRLVLVLAIGVVAYIFKDRIKELTREWFNERMKKYLPDFDLKLSFPLFDEDGTVREISLGTAREYMRYLTRAAIPPDVLYLRDLGNRPDLDPERHEAIIHYSKRLSFDGLVGQHPLHQVRHIRDVMRLDVSEFLSKLSDPKKSLGYFHPERGLQTLKAPRVYHVNVVFRYAVSHHEGARRLLRDVTYERVRIVIDKEGIIRIETVSPRGQLGYVEDEAS
ncbi:MAG: hypothetical protein VKO21_11985 [Candidatus Sericytochromatia bacterium]|nr:hypothetical protein [Candidatus Sericytochromatia bacterium]